jgi:hypothetical protein
MLKNYISSKLYVSCRNVIQTLIGFEYRPLSQSTIKPLNFKFGGLRAVLFEDT